MLRTNQQFMLSSNSTAKKKPDLGNSSSLRVVSINDKGKHKSPKWLLWALLLIGSVFLIHHFYMGDQEIPSGVIVTLEGNLELSPERKAKLDKELVLWAGFFFAFSL
mgnify:CR=1 FL=1